VALAVLSTFFVQFRQRLGHLLVFLRGQSTGVAHGACSLSEESKRTPKALEQGPGLFVVGRGSDHLGVGEVLGEHLAEAHQDFRGVLANGFFAKQLLYDALCGDDPSVKIEEIGVEGKSLSLAIAGVIQEPLVEAEENLSPQDLGIGDLEYLPRQQVWKRQGVFGIVESLPKPLRLSSSLLLEPDLKFQGTHQLGEGVLWSSIEIVAHIPQQMILADPVRNLVGQCVLTGPLHRLAQIVEHICGPPISFPSFTEALRNLVRVFRGNLPGTQHDAFLGLFHTKEHGTARLQRAVDEPGHRPPFVEILLEDRSGLAVEFTVIEQKLVLNVVEAAERNVEVATLVLAQFLVNELELTAIDKGLHSHVSDEVITIAMAFRDQHLELRGVMSEGFLTLALLLTHDLLRLKGGVSQAHHGAAQKLLRRPREGRRFVIERIPIETVDTIRRELARGLKPQGRLFEEVVK